MPSKDQTIHEVTFAGHKLVLDAAGVIYLPEFATLLVSDMHLEKGSFLAAAHNPLPGYDTLDTLQRLDESIQKYSPKRVLCMGDSFHDSRASSRIVQQDAERLNDMCGNDELCEWIWVLGNHDANFPTTIKGVRVASYKLGNINLSHEGDGEEYEIIGHYHPKIKLSIHGHRISGKCFIYDKNLLIMPSFGSFTGGMYVTAPELRSKFKSRPEITLIYKKKIWVT